MTETKTFFNRVMTERPRHQPLYIPMSDTTLSWARQELLYYMLTQEPLFPIADEEETPIAFFEETISEVLEARTPDPLTEDWRVISEFPRYSINRCGEVMNNETGRILKRGYRDDRGRKDGTYSKIERQGFTINGVVHGRTTGSLLKAAFPDIKE